MKNDNSKSKNALTFDERMLVFHGREKKYIMKGPQLLRPDLQGTQCTLFLNVDKNELSSVFRSQHDLYNKDYSICDLPDLPLANSNDQRARINLSRSNHYDSILEQMQYDEELQMTMFRSKAQKVFTGMFAHLDDLQKTETC